MMVYFLTRYFFSFSYRFTWPLFAYFILNEFPHDIFLSYFMYKLHCARLTFNFRYTINISVLVNKFLIMYVSPVWVRKTSLFFVIFCLCCVVFAIILNQSYVKYHFELKIISYLLLNNKQIIKTQIIVQIVGQNKNSISDFSENKIKLVFVFFNR